MATDRLDPLLSGPEQQLEHNTEFTGRPTTRLYVGESCVAKLRQEGFASQQNAQRWAELQLRRERQLAIHDPAKTWFVLREGDTYHAGNIAPRLRTLQSPQNPLSLPVFLDHLRQMLRMYADSAVRAGLRLDEGLSNFGADAAGRVYYLDDDFYAWDGGAHLAHFLGVIIRKYAASAPSFATVLGEMARSAFVKLDGGAEILPALARHVEAIYFAEGAQQDAGAAFLSELKAIAVRRKPRTAAAVPEPLRLSGSEPIALIADVHSNLPALHAVGAEIARRGIRQTLLLGDVVGYGPHPRECIRYVQDAGYQVIKGNHDHAAATGDSGLGFSHSARLAIDWTRTQLDAAEMRWLGALPLRAEGPRWIAQHGAPMDPEYFRAYVYRMTYEENLDFLAGAGIRYAFHGHTHIAGIYLRQRGAVRFSNDAAQALKAADGALICPGSVGQPRGGVTGAEFAIFHQDAESIELFRLPYDLEHTLCDMTRIGLPEPMIRRMRAAQ